MRALLLTLFWLCAISVFGQNGINQITIKTDQDLFAPGNEDRNYTMGFFLSVGGGSKLNSKYWLGLPYIRKHTLDKLVDKGLSSIFSPILFAGAREQYRFEVYGTAFTPEQLSDTTADFSQKIMEGYRLEDDRPFSFVFGFTSERIKEIYERRLNLFWPDDLQVTSGFSFALYGTGIGDWFQSFVHENNCFGSTRPVPLLWKSDTSKPYPTGQIKRKAIPTFLFYNKLEKPLAILEKGNFRLITSLHNEVYLGYLTNTSFGGSFAFGKFQRRFTYASNIANTGIGLFPAFARSVGGWSIIGGYNLRFVGYNGHLSNIFDFTANETGNALDADVISRVIYEFYFGVTAEFQGFSINFIPLIRRSKEFDTPESRSHSYGSFSLAINI